MEWAILSIPFLILFAAGLTLWIHESKDRARSKGMRARDELQRFRDRLGTLRYQEKLTSHQYGWLMAHWEYATCDPDELIIQSLPDYYGEIIKS